MTNLATKKYLDVPPQMVLEIAYGVEDPQAVAERHGFSSSEWFLLKEHAPFVKQVENKKTELKASGYTFRLKSAIAAEDLLEDVYRKAKAEDASFHTQLETLKFFAKAAGLEAPTKAETATGPAFSITINLGNGQSMHIGTAGNVQDASVIESDTDVASFEFDLPEPPPHLFNVTNNLVMEISE